MYVKLRWMSHIIQNKQKVLARIRRVRGQVEALERAVGEEQDCSDILQLMSATRGAMNSLMSELLEGHIRNHVLGSRRARAERAEAAEEVIDMVKSYLR
jgi:FrmR/RcnR family transcriptional regulator, repressor of frmRAB operon